MDFSKLKQKKLFLLDMDGTIYLGDNLFDGTKDFLTYIKNNGGKYLFLTNNSSRSSNAYVERLSKMGIDARVSDFLTSVDASIWKLKNEVGDKLIYASGTETFVSQLRDSGLNITTSLNDNIEVLLHGFDTELTFRKLEDSCKLLKKGVKFYATNPDWVCPTSWGSVPDCGSVCEMLFTATGKRPIYIGKPESTMVDLALSKYGYKKEEAVMIGDRVYTDIKSGVNAGIDTVFVLSGEGVVEDFEKYDVHPTWTISCIKEVLDIIKS